MSCRLYWPSSSSHCGTCSSRQSYATRRRPSRLSISERWTGVRLAASNGTMHQATRFSRAKTSRGLSWARTLKAAHATRTHAHEAVFALMSLLLHRVDGLQRDEPDRPEQARLA